MQAATAQEIFRPFMNMDEATLFFDKSKKSITNWFYYGTLPRELKEECGKGLKITKSKLFKFILGEKDYKKYPKATLISELQMADILDVPKNIPDKARKNRVQAYIRNNKIPKSVTKKIGDSVYVIKEKYEAYLT